MNIASSETLNRPQHFEYGTSGHTLDKINSVLSHVDQFIQSFIQTEDPSPDIALNKSKIIEQLTLLDSLVSSLLRYNLSDQEQQLVINLSDTIQSFKQKFCDINTNFYSGTNIEEFKAETANTLSDTERILTNFRNTISEISTEHVSDLKYNSLTTEKLLSNLQDNNPEPEQVTECLQIIDRLLNDDHSTVKRVNVANLISFKLKQISKLQDSLTSVELPLSGKIAIKVSRGLQRNSSGVGLGGLKLALSGNPTKEQKDVWKIIYRHPGSRD